jgi:hypothetical protein
MSRKRFNAEEKAVIAGGPGTDVEWQNVTQWHAARILTGEIITDDGWQSVKVTTLTGTRTVSAGQVIDASPGHIRARYGYNPGNASQPAGN